MRRSVPRLFVILCLAVSQSAYAQVVWDMPNVLREKPKFNELTTRPRADVWPRLDPGAVLCKTEADLLRLAASRRGEPGESPNCQMIRTPTAIKVEQRAGPGRTQVSLTDVNGLQGWTDAWLPERPQAPGGRAISIK